MSKKSARCDRAARVLAGRPPRTAAGCARPASASARSSSIGGCSTTPAPASTSPTGPTIKRARNLQMPQTLRSSRPLSPNGNLPPGVDNSWKRHECDPNPLLGAQESPEMRANVTSVARCKQGSNAARSSSWLAVNSRASSPWLSPRRPGPRSARWRARPGRPARSECPRSGVRRLPGWPPRRRSPTRA